MNHVIHIYAEPAIYTVDLISNIDKQLKIEVGFINNNSKYKYSDEDVYKKITLKDIIRISKTKKIIIINGIINRVFIILFLFRLLRISSFVLAIESDTPYKKAGFIKSYIKKFIFSRSFVFGLAGGNYDHKEYFEKNGMNENRIFVFPMVVNNNKFIKKPIKIKTTVNYYFIGKFYKRKNISFLLEAFVHAKQKNKNIELHLIGSGDKYHSLKSKYDSYEYIHFYGDVNNQELGNYMEDFHYIILPSLHEPWGLVINESYSSGKLALVSNRVGCINDFKDLMQDWMIFDPKNIKSLIHTILVSSKYSDYFDKAKMASDFMKRKWNYSYYEKNMHDFINQISNKNNW